VQIAKSQSAANLVFPVDLSGHWKTPKQHKIH
jgi:hypothetical protein